MLRFCVPTLSLFAITIAISLSSVEAQVYRSYRVEHSWKTRPQSVPEVMLELAKERREERRIEEERKFLLQLERERQQATNPQTIYVHVPASQQGPTWAEYREVAKTLQETQLALAKLQAEIAHLNTQPARQSTRNVATTKVVSRQKQYHRANPRYVKPASTQYVKSKSMRLIDDLREIGFPLDIAIKASMAVLDYPNKSERSIIRRTLLGHAKMSNGEKAKLWMLYTARNK